MNETTVQVVVWLSYSNPGSIFFRSLWKNIDCFFGAPAAASMSAERDICVTDVTDWLRQNKVIH